MAATVEAHPVVLPWERFAEVFQRAHRQGEHIALVGQTGSGKTVLELELAKILASRRTTQGRPASVTILATKPRDDNLRRLGWPIVKAWPPSYGQEAAIVWPKARTPSTAMRDLRRVYSPLLDAIYHEGGQTVVIDEAADFEDALPTGMGLAGTLNRYWRTGRSLKLTLLAGTQRPRRVSVSMWTEPSWVFSFHIDDREDLKRVADLSGRKEEVLELVPRLGGYEFLCVRRQRGGQRELYVSRVEPPSSSSSKPSSKPQAT